MRYDRADASLDRHATYIVAGYLAGGARLSKPVTPGRRRRALTGQRRTVRVKIRAELLENI